MRLIDLLPGIQGDYSEMRSREGDAIMRRSKIRVKQQIIDRMKPKDESTILFKIASEENLVKARTGDDFWKALLCMCKSMNTELRVLKEKSRLREVVEIRQLIWFISYYHHNTTLNYLGRFFNRDHATVLHGIRNISTFISSKNPDLKILRLMDRMLTGLMNEGLIVSKEYYTRQVYKPSGYKNDKK
jgi:hypothetical protein